MSTPTKPNKYEYFRKLVPDPIIFTEVEKYAIQNNKSGLFNKIFFYDSCTGEIDTGLYRGFYKIYSDSCELVNVESSDYEKYYFKQHPRASKKPIENPYHPTINQWMIMKRPMMNALKQRWKDFIQWFIENQGYTNLHIEKCEMKFITYYKTNRRHDIDNGCPKFILDGLSESRFIVDDDSKHITSLTMECYVDKDNPRTEIYVKVSD